VAKKPGQDLQSAIYSKGYQWVAGSTSVSGLTSEQQKGRLGLRVDPKQLAATAKAIQAVESMRAAQRAGFGAPAAVDWRNQGGDWITPIRDQGDCGSCVSFGTAATIEARLNIVCRNPNLDADLSEAHLFFCGCGNCCDTGWNPEPALDFAKNTGVAVESAFAYSDHDQPCPAGLTPYIKITNWSALLSAADRKNSLATKGPVVGCLAVFRDFFSYRSGVYRHVSGDLAGYHCVSVIGYDDNLQCWIAKNSWGPGWGDGGFFRIGYGEASMDTEFNFQDVDLTCPDSPSDTCEQYLPGLRRVLEAARNNSALRRCLRYYVCGRPPRPICSRAYLDVVRAVLAILRQCPQYRAPFCRALG